MRVDGSINYATATPDQVFAMIATPEFQRQKCAATGALSYDVDVRNNGSHTVITCTRVLPTDSLPDFVRPIAGPRLELVETIDWAAPTDEGVRLADVRLRFTSQPLSMVGRLRLAGDGSGTVAELRAELTANIAFFGPRIEKACAPLVGQALRVEQSVGEKWLAGQT